MFVLTWVPLLRTLLVYKYSSCVLLHLRLNIAIPCLFLPTQLLCLPNLVLCLARCALSAPTSDFGSPRPLTLWNSEGVPAALPPTLRTRLGLRLSQWYIFRIFQTFFLTLFIRIFLDFPICFMPIPLYFSRILWPFILFNPCNLNLSF